MFYRENVKEPYVGCIFVTALSFLSNQIKGYVYIIYIYIHMILYN